MSAGRVQPINTTSMVLRSETERTAFADVERIEQAKNLLLNPHYSLSEIAEHLGFESLVHFDRRFKHITGHSAKAYRQFVERLNIDAPQTRVIPMKDKPLPEKLSIVILYTDRVKGQEALRTCNHALNRFESENCFEFRLWRLDLLEEPDIRAQAGRDVAAADIIVVTVDEDRSYSESFQQWAQCWPEAHRGARRALVSFGSGGSKSESRCQDFLQDLARRKGMDFLSNRASNTFPVRTLRIEWGMAEQEPLGIPVASGSRAKFARETLGQTIPAFNRWGINE